MLHCILAGLVVMAAAAAGLETTPLRGTLLPLGQWLTEVHVGSQGPFEVVFDTGSSDLLVVNAECV